MTILRDIKTVIIHVPKTGGSSVRWSAMNKFNSRYACQHCAYKMLPEKFKDYRKITFVRNPLEWYASRFFFDKKKWDMRGRAKREPFTDALSDEYSLTFKQTLPRMLNLTETFKDQRVFNSFKDKLRKEANNNYQVWWVSYFDDIEALTPEDFGNKSLYQWFLDICGVENCDAVYRLEDQYAYGMKREFGEDIELMRKNVTGRRKSEDIYTPEMSNSVIQVERDFMKKYGY